MKSCEPVLEFLRASRESFVSGEEISRKLKVSRATVWKDIQRLRELDYEIEAQPHLGYRLLSVPDRLYADEIRSGLKTRVVGRELFCYDELDSTNDTAFLLGEKGVKEGACIFTEHQKKGRGRLGRSWSSPKGKNILMSVLLRPDIAPSQVSKITLTTAVAVIRAMKAFVEAPLGIKWPNDILSGKKKVCGILTEMSAETDRVKFIVLGIGINVNASASELPPNSVSLKELGRHAIARHEFAKKILQELDDAYALVKKGDFDKIAKEWEDFSVTSGQRVAVNMRGRRVEGQAVGIDPDGCLWIRTDDGLQERVLSGDVERA